MRREERTGISLLTFSLKWHDPHHLHQNDHDYSLELG